MLNLKAISLKIKAATMTQYIRYDEKTDKFEATKKRPNNQNSVAVLEKIAGRLKKYILEDDTLTHTPLQEIFIKNVENKYPSFLSKEKIDIAHHISISQIIDVLVEILNNPNKTDIKILIETTDAIYSTDDDETRNKTKNICQQMLDKNADKKKLCNDINGIILVANKSSRNLICGINSINRKIGSCIDQHFLQKKDDNTNFVETPPSKNISEKFNQLPGRDQYNLRTIQENGREYIYSSSVPSYVFRNNGLFSTPAAVNLTSNQIPAFIDKGLLLTLN